MRFAGGVNIAARAFAKENRDRAARVANEPKREHRGETRVGFAREKQVQQPAEGFQRQQQPGDAQPTKHPAPAPHRNRRDCREQIDPTPLHERGLGRRAAQPF